METDSDDYGCERDCDVVKSTKKKKRSGRLTEVSKKLNLQSHTVGPDCNCKRFKCFQNIPEQARAKVIQNFNLLSSINEQNSYLCGLIVIQEIHNRRPRLDETNANLRDASYSYRVRVLDDGIVKEVQVCRQAFLSIHGIGKKKLEVLQKGLKLTGSAPKDMRGKHSSAHRKLPDEKLNAVKTHISSFKGRKGHYNLSESNKVYLPEDLNIRKMYNMYCETNNNLHVSYETYRTIFSTNFNISFGYPRKDTCSTCDELIAKIKNLESEQVCLSTDANLKEELKQKQKVLETQHILHKKKADVFYKRKRNAKYKSKVDESMEAVCFDYQKNLPVPNLSTNDVYYRRQLSVFSFNIHVLSSNRSVFYTYPETIGNKGSDDVTSMIHHFVYNFLDMNVRHLYLFCDSCGGQNKNYTMFRFLHSLVHTENRFDEIKICFPIRGHSYMEPDKNMGLINQKAKVELPSQWADIFRETRVKPCPFDVVEVDQTIFRKWTDHLSKIYIKKCPFKTRPLRELKVVKSHPRFIFHRDTYNGHFNSTVVTNRGTMRKNQTLTDNEFELPDMLYEGGLYIIFQ